MSRFLWGILVLCFTFTLSAQEFRATIEGRVTDSSGAGVSDAKVVATSVDRNVPSATVTDSDGHYLISYLTPGAYVLTVEKAGFQKIVQQGVNVSVAEHATLDFNLTVGEVNQTVTVSANADVLETQTADRGNAISSTTVLNAPLMGRNPFAIAWSSPGVVLTAGAQRLRPFDISGSSSMTINGGPPKTNEVLVDGVSSLYQASSVSYVPTADAMSEFKVQTTNYDAQYGWTLGGVINIITKSGSNDFHGSLFEFFQNTHLNAATFNQNRTGVGRTSSHINTFGGDISGPIKKNKLFFTYTYENIRQVIPDPFIVSVPTALQRQGDFSQTFYGRSAAGAPLQQAIFNPYSTVTGPDGKLTRVPFGGNVIPTPMMDPVAVKVLSYIPAGNVAGDPTTGLNNLSNSGSTRKFTDYFPENTARVDYEINESTRLFVRYSRNALQEERSFHYSTNSTINPADTGKNNPFTRENHNATIQFTKTLSPTSVFDFRLGLERFKSEGGSEQGRGVGPSTLGFSPTYVAQAANWFPRFNWANYDGAGAQPTTIDPTAQTNSAQASMSKVMGRESLKFGGEFRLLRSYSQNPGYNAGSFSFDQQFTGANALQIQPASGNSIASFLLGTAQSGFINANSQPARQEKMFSLYMQNDINLTSKLKVNVGLRWDYMGALTDRFDQLPRGFADTTPNPLQVPGVSLYGGVLFAGANGQPRGIYNQSWGNLGPRLGVAYQLTNSTVLRGGYGLIYGQTWNDPGNAPGFSQQTNMVSFIQTGIPNDTLDNPFPGGVLTPAGSSQGLLTALGQTYQFADPDGKPPYVQQFSFEVQQQLGHDYLLSAGYIGSRSNRLPVNQQLNGLPISALGLGASALSASVANPFVGLLPGTALNGKTVAQQQLLVAYPQFLASTNFGGTGGILEMYRPIGTSSYNSAQFAVKKRYSYGLNFTAAYTISKQIDQASFANAQDTQLERVIAAWDIPQNLQIQLGYELPFGTGKPWGSQLVKPLRWGISGWQVNTLARLQKGMPMNFPTNAAATGADPSVSDPSLTQWFNTCTLLASGATRGCTGNEQPAWTIRQPDTLQRWSSRLASVRLPGIHNVDISLIKHNHITERIDLAFRADFINAFNTPQFFGGPNTDVNNANFGRISGYTDQSNLPRFVQLSMKLQF